MLNIFKGAPSEKVLGKPLLGIIVRYCGEQPPSGGVVGAGGGSSIGGGVGAGRGPRNANQHSSTCALGHHVFTDMQQVDWRIIKRSSRVNMQASQWK